MITETKEMTNRELDALVAERVMGLTLRHESSGYGTLAIGSKGIEKNAILCKWCLAMFDVSVYLAGERCAAAAPRYSTKIAHAMLVVEKMRERGWFPNLWAAQVWNVEIYEDGGDMHNLKGSANEDSLPRAICLAALEAVKEKEN